MKDLIVRAADQDMEQALIGLFSRPESLGTRKIVFDIFVDSARHDPGCFKKAHNFLRPFIKQYAHALVLFDHYGCGQERQSVETVQGIVENDLSSSGWRDRSAAIVINPELEIWVWSDSPNVAECLGWQTSYGDLRDWLERENHWPSNQTKPTRPKEVMRMVLRRTNTPRSARIFKELGERVSLRRCEDPAFNRLCTVLRNWFPR